MNQSFWDRYIGEDISNDRREFNILHLVTIFGLLFSTVLVYIFIPDIIAFYFSLGTVIFAVLTFVEANRINNTKIPAIIMSLFFNFVFLTMMYLSYGRIVCMLPVYFVFGLLYSVMIVGGKLGLILSTVEALFYVVIIIYGNHVQINAGLEAEANIYDYIGVALAIIISGVAGGLIVKYKVRIQEKEKEKADEYHALVMKDYLSKDVFLINLSHEIRTPMNAIVGNVNMLLDQDIDDRVRECSYNILNSCNALLSITNEMMDISQSDNNYEFLKIRYDFYDLLMEIINMISVRLMDSTIDFFVEISENIPRFMYSDVVKIRQLITNILNNAVKYTKTGRIILRINAEIIDNENITLLFEVEDTGIGIKKELIPTLFNVYDSIQGSVDDLKNISGSGLGLSVCKEILDKLNGEIHVNSEYHVGSTFHFSFPQKYEPNKYLYSVNSPSLYNAIIYEKDEDNKEQLIKILDNMKIRYSIPGDNNDLIDMINSHNYTHVFIAYEKYMDCIKFLDNGIRSEKLIVISYLTQPVSLNSYGNIITRPAHALNVSAALNNESNNYVREVIKSGGFTCPEATILVVDDNLTNLTVAGGLLKKYNAKVITALSGKECLNILERQKVDIVFLDYMMPEMNGIDTLQRIRVMDNGRLNNLPVVVLTANVVNGAKEMFIEAGFDYFISKPIEIDKIEIALKTFLSRDMIVISPR